MHQFWPRCLVFLVLHIFIADGGRVHVINIGHRYKRDAGDKSGHGLGNNRSRMPDKMALGVDLDDEQSVRLNLERNDHVNNVVPVIIGVGGKMKPWKSSVPEEFAVYTDVENQAAIFVNTKRQNDGSSSHEFMGIFKKGENFFTMEPPGRRFDPPLDRRPEHAGSKGRPPHSESKGKPPHASTPGPSKPPPGETSKPPNPHQPPGATSTPLHTPPPTDTPTGEHQGGKGRGKGNRRGRRSGRRNKRNAQVDDDEEYVITAVNSTTPFLDYDTDAMSCEQGEEASNNSDTVLYSCMRSRIRRLAEREAYREEILEYNPQANSGGKIMYGVETLVVVDYAIFKSWYDMSDSDTYEGRRDDAINSIRYYYSHIINGVDLRYMSINEHDFGIYVRLAGFYIPTTPDASPWTEGHLVREVENGRVYTHAYRALDELESWLDVYQTELPYFDVATLFAGNKLFGGYSSSGARRNIAGLADIGGVCSYFRANINQENGQYASTQTASHEIGHNLGAFHDGSANSCSKYDQYIMAPTPVKLKDSNFLNPYSFSPCSVQEMREQIRVLDLRGMNCLNNAAQHINQTEIDIHLQIPPGQMFSLDEQCRNLFGPFSYYCGGVINDERMCEEIYCYDTWQKKCWRGHEQRAATGTTCGNKKWCDKGKCVYNDRAPEAKDYCLSGNFLGEFYDGTTCQEIGRSIKRRCYEQEYKDACCETCDAVEDLSQPDCPYGDRVVWCDDLQAKDCYDPQYRHSCCGGCLQEYTGVTGCEYGDKANWCRKDVPSRPRLCYDSAPICCETCPPFATGSPGCLYGDKASWCDTYLYTPWECYRTDISDKCCQLCQEAADRYGVEGGRYGDRKSRQDCYTRNCRDSRNWYDCSYTCRYEAGYSRLTTTPITTTTTSTAAATTTTATTTTVPTTTTQTTTTTQMPVTVKPNDCKDTASWCVGEDFTASYCYSSSDICCQTCSQYYTGIQGCEYRDEFSWCEDHVDDCHYEQYQEDCCYTCGEHISTTNDTPGSNATTSPPSTTEKILTTTTTTSTTSSTSQAPSTTTISTTYPSSTRTTTRNEPSTTRTTADTSTTRTTTMGVVTEISWCPGIHLSACYSLYSDCPITCVPISDMPECEFGDHYSWCKEMSYSQCLLDEVRAGCSCIHCLQYNMSTSVPQSTVTASTTTSTTMRTTSSTTTTISSTTVAATTTTTSPEEIYDQYIWCAIEVRSVDCYLPVYRDEYCPATCKKFETGITGCEYGDKYSWCDTVDIPTDCRKPAFSEPCCVKCDPDMLAAITTTTSPHETAGISLTTSPPSGCEKDQAAWCQMISSHDCYVDADVCCATCPLYYIPHSGCQYGDSVSWCFEAINGVSDCNRSDIMDNCCYTCFQLGFSPPEKIEEMNEGNLLEIHTSKQDLSVYEVPLVETVTDRINQYCVNNIAKCCESYSTESRNKRSVEGSTNSGWKVEDVYVAAGYPRDGDNPDTAWTKLLVQVDPDQMKLICQSGTSPRSRHKREVQTKITYMNKKLLHSILTTERKNIERATGLKILQITVPGSSSSLQEEAPVLSTRWLCMVVAIALCVIAMVVAVTIAKSRYDKAKKKFRNVGPANSDQSPLRTIPTVYNNHTFMMETSPEHKLYNLRQNEEALTKSMPAIAWPEIAFEKSLDIYTADDINDYPIVDEKYNFYSTNIDKFEESPLHEEKCLNLYSQSLPVISENEGKFPDQVGNLHVPQMSPKNNIQREILNSHKNKASDHVGNDLK